MKITAEKIDAVDDATRTLTYGVIDGGLLNYFEHYKGIPRCNTLGTWKLGEMVLFV